VFDYRFTDVYDTFGFKFIFCINFHNSIMLHGYISIHYFTLS
jgi:hypothetical protein